MAYKSIETLTKEYSEAKEKYHVARRECELNPNDLGLRHKMFSLKSKAIHAYKRYNPYAGLGKPFCEASPEKMIEV